MAKKYTLFSITLCLLLGLAGSSSAKMKLFHMIVCATKGTVIANGKIKHNSKQDCALTHSGRTTDCAEYVGNGMIVHTGQYGWAEIQLVSKNGIRVRLKPNSTLRILGDGIYLAKGALHISHTENIWLRITTPFILLPISQRQDVWKLVPDQFGKVDWHKINVHTGQVNLVPKGTEFTVAVKDDETTFVRLLEGKLEVSDINKKKTIMLTAGMEIRVADGSPPSIPLLSHIADSEKWWTDWPTLVPIAEMPPGVGGPAQGTAKLLTAKSNRDMVGRNEIFRGNGKADAGFQAQFSAPNRTVTAVEVSNTNGLRSVWDTRPNNRLWLGGVVFGGRVMNRPDGSVNIRLGSGQTTLVYFVEDNGSIRGGKTNYRMTIFFASGDPLIMNIVPGGGGPGSSSSNTQKGESNLPEIAGEWEITCTGGTIWIFNLKLNQSGDKFYGKMVCTNRSNPLTKVEGRISPDGNIEFIRSAGSWRQYYHGKIVQKSGTQATFLKGLYGDKGQEKLEWHAKLLSASKSSSGSSTKCGLGKSWDVTEPYGWTSVWSRRSNSNIFDALWTNGAKQEKAVLTISINGNTVNVKRKQSAGSSYPGQECTYKGTLAADNVTVTGTYGCAWAAGPFNWQATIRCDSGGGSAASTTGALPPSQGIKKVITGYGKKK